MATIATDLQQILDVAPEYSRAATPAMLKRKEIEADLAANLASALESMGDPSGAVMLGVRVKAGGRQNNQYGP